MRLDTLTPAQVATLAVQREKWLAVGLSTAPADRVRAEAGVRAAYQAAGLEPPAIIVWLESPMRGAIGAALLAQVGDQVGDQVGAQVWAQVGAQVGDQVRAQVGAQVRAQVGAQVGDQVGAQVRDQVLAQVRAQVGAQVGAAGYGSHDASWVGFYDTFRAFGLDTSRLDGIAALTETCGWWWPFRGLCILTERPVSLSRDAEHRLHAEDRAAVAYPDGWGVYAWHGVRVPDAVILRPELLTPTQIRDEPNAEIRRVMLDRFGHDRFIAELGALPVDASKFGTLYRVELPDDEPLVMVSLINSTPEPASADRTALVQGPDGSWSKRYWLRVPPDITTAHAAVAWTFQKTPAEYQPVAET